MSIILRKQRICHASHPSALLVGEGSLKLRRGTAWFRAENVKGLRLEDFHVSDPEGHIAANWPDGVFALEGCDDRRFTDVSVNGVEMK